ncbi:hypothetical protein [Embleya hyalina]|uniref:Lipoprotein n=1 Tax=Embleya hyalina TaxID=516124 RepID=A0A401YDC9_9ACTN|nr:hypothetical protein [Embleya hyalina]GCD92603.1 hypothetical protein EHYA_00242 [Embleya hyalina]
MPTTATRTTGPLAALALTAVIVASATACTGSGGHADAERPPFSAAPATVTCQEHQRSRPGPDYTSQEDADTAKIMTVLEHYTANGRKPYCDGRAATAADLAWARLYVDMGADAAYLSPGLGGAGVPDEDPTPSP